MGGVDFLDIYQQNHLLDQDASAYKVLYTLQFEVLSKIQQTYSNLV